MPQILHTTLNNGRNVLAAGESFSFDLPVNPLSVILLTFRALNNVLVNVTAVADFLNKYTNVNVRYRGASIHDAPLKDTMIEAMVRSNWRPGFGQQGNVNNDGRSLTVPILFGRKPYDAKECFPATRRGDLILSMTAAADAGGLDGHSVQVETVELLDAAPERFIKFTETQQAMAAAGQNSIALPMGNKLLGVLMRPFAYPTDATFLSSFGEVSLEVDNVEVMYSHTNWETLHGMAARRLHGSPLIDQHTHPYITAAVATEYFTRQSVNDTDLAQEYGLLDLDPHNDTEWALDTKGASDVKLSIVSDTADVANVSRIFPRELIETGTGAVA